MGKSNGKLKLRRRNYELGKLEEGRGMRIGRVFGKVKERQGMGISTVLRKWNWDPLVLDLEK